MDITWEWVPGKSVGPFVFGAPAGPVIEQFRLKLLDRDVPTADWDTYAIPGMGSRVYVRDGVIDSVFCNSECNYSGVNLIGLGELRIKKLLGAEDTKEENQEIGYVMLSYDAFGLSVWIENGIVTTAICHAIVRD